MSRRVGFRWFCLTVLACGAALHAADSVPPANSAVTDRTQADADFAFQGEYLGTTTGPGSSEYLGVNVIALGDGRFDAVLLRGGLPGAGWDRATRLKLSGERRGELVTLAADDRAITVSPEYAWVQDSQGNELARLPRIDRVSLTAGASPPAHAIVLFDGSTPTQLENARLTPDGLLETGSTTKFPVRDFHLHVEFRTPYMPHARGQGRGNSGVYIQQRYEVQILDSFGLDGVANECGGVYRQQAPDVNMCLPPLSWQTYDIHFTAARWESAAKKIANARLTVYHNGEPIHLNRELPEKTGAGQKETPDPRPIHFQHHGNPVQFRNVWIVLEDHDGYCEAASPTNCRPAIVRARRCRF